MGVLWDAPEFSRYERTTAGLRSDFYAKRSPTIQLGSSCCGHSVESIGHSVEWIKNRSLVSRELQRYKPIENTMQEGRQKYALRCEFAKLLTYNVAYIPSQSRGCWEIFWYPNFSIFPTSLGDPRPATVGQLGVVSAEAELIGRGPRCRYHTVRFTLLSVHIETTI